MSGRKSSSNKITLGMLKGKSITTSVPTFAIRFHAEDEELEEIYPSAEESDEEAEKQEDESSSSAGGTQASGTGAQTGVTSSASATASTIHSRDPSPMKEYLKGFGKRSTSVDAGMIEGGTPVSGSDTWRIFHEIKGKIAKTVEEKFGEMKTDRRSSSSVFSGNANMRGGRLVGGGSKDDSSINSDSEDISESSGKGQESKSVLKKEKKDENSPKKTVMFPKSPKGKNDVPSATLDTPSTSGAHDSGSNVSAPTTPSKSKKTPLTSASSSKKLKDNDISVKVDKDVIVEQVPTFVEEEVESGVEVDEKMTFNATEEEDETIPTIDYRQPFPVTIPPLKPKVRRKKSFLRRIRWWIVKLLPFVGIIIYYTFPLPPFVSGLISGIFIGLVITAIHSKIQQLISPDPGTLPEDNIIQRDTEFSIPDYSTMPILEIPAVKEFHHINKYHGWMNEYRHDYDPDTYSLNDTNSVYIRLEGPNLRISHTKQRIPKRAMWNERPHKLKFYHQRIYSIENCKLKLLPEGLTRRRIWSKKYPICIILARYSKVSVRDFSDSDKTEKNKITDEVADLPTDPDEHQDQEEVETKDDNFQQGSDGKEGSATPDISLVEESDDDTFCHVDKPEAMEKCLYLFARTDREKEDWYRSFAAAIRHSRSPEEEEVIINSPEGTPDTTPKEEGLADILPVQAGSSSLSAAQVLTGGLGQSDQLYTFPMNDYMAVKSFESRDYEYLRFMSKFQEATPLTTTQKKKQEIMESDLDDAVKEGIDADVMWVNSLVGRVLFDILKNPEMIDKIKERLQRKMSTIKLPYFIEDLIITELDLGHNMPLAHRASRPRLDERGLWIDLDVTYDGTACFTLVTKLNLMKIKQMGEVTAATSEKEDTSQGDKGKSPMYDSDLDDTAESSDDDNAEDEGKSTSGEDKSASTGSTGKKFIQVVNKIAASKYFQQATEYKYIKKAMQKVSNTNLVLTVEVNAMIGKLAINIPPPPSDRLWYGFRGNPRLWLQARPKVGERQVSVSQVTSWIEKQLCKEFQKKFVLPNMDDLVIPPMTTELPK